jgi:hypothetical protein
MENREKRMGNGEWRVEDGEWRMENGDGLYYDCLFPPASFFAAPHGRLAAAVLTQAVEAHVVLLRYEQWLEPFAQAL